MSKLLPKLMGISIAEAVYTKRELSDELRSMSDDGIACLRANVPVTMLLTRKQTLALVHQLIDTLPDSSDRDSTEINVGSFEVTIYEVDSKLWARSK